MAQKSNEEQQARELYLNTNMTQEQIANLLNLNRKTVGLWIDKGKWKQMKAAALNAPGIILQDLYTQLAALNMTILSRDEANRFPTLEESTIQRRLLLSVKNFEVQPAGNYMQTYIELLTDIAGRDNELAKKIVPYADQIVKKKLHDKTNTMQNMFMTDDINELDDLDKDIKSISPIHKRELLDKTKTVDTNASPAHSRDCPTEQAGDKCPSDVRSCDISNSHITQQDQPLQPEPTPPNSHEKDLSKFTHMPHLRPYEQKDYSSVIELFKLNTPKYFCPCEQDDIESFLLKHADTYYVVEQDDKILASGGYHIDGNKGKLSWYITHPDAHRKGYGSMLRDNAVNILKNNAALTRIEVQTSQLVFKFYEDHGFTYFQTIQNYWCQGMHLIEFFMDLK